MKLPRGVTVRYFSPLQFACRDITCSSVSLLEPFSCLLSTPRHHFAPAGFSIMISRPVARFSSGLANVSSLSRSYIAAPSSTRVFGRAFTSITPCQRYSLATRRSLARPQGSSSLLLKQRFFQGLLARHESSAPPGSTFKSTSSPSTSGSESASTPSATPESSVEGENESAIARTRKTQPEDVPAPQPDSRGEVPAYELTFTCKPCLTRSTHRISKHGYHNGTVLIRCPQCKNRHVISDHLKIFNDTSKSFEDILAEKGLGMKTGVLDPEGDVELWDDGSHTTRDQGKESREGAK